METQPVIVAVDGSDDSLRALDFALEEARLRGTVLRLVHVRQAAARTRNEKPAAATEKPAEDPVLVRVRAMLADREGPPDLEYLSVAGTPGSALPELGATAQLLVLGSRGRGGFASLLLGSSGLAAARDAACPVVVVPRPGREVHADSLPRPGRRVVVGVPADTADDRTLSFAFSSASRRSARLEAVSAFPWPSHVWTAAGDFTPNTEDPEPSRTAAASVVHDVLESYRSRFPDVTVELRVAPGDAAGHVVAASKDAELVVVGRHHRHPLSPARLIGSVSNAVLLHAASPVAVVPPLEERDRAAGR